jgi:hypothetical protein
MYVRPEIDPGRIYGMVFAMAGENNRIHAIYLSHGKRRRRAAIWRLYLLLLFILHQFGIIHPGTADNTYLDIGHNLSFKQRVLIKKDKRMVFIKSTLERTSLKYF